MMNLTGRGTALVTGGAKRLGRAMAEALAADGFDVVVHYRTSATAAEELAADLARLGVDARCLAADLADPAQVERLAREAGPVDVLVNNASIYPADTLRTTDAAAVARNVAVHATAPLLLARALFPGDRPGLVVNMLDTRIHEYDRDHAAYHLSKRMLFTLTRMLAVELAPAVRVNAIAPGAVLPPADQDDAYLERLAAAAPLQRVGSPTDIVAALRYLVVSDFVTGQVLFVDGGRHLKGMIYG